MKFKTLYICNATKTFALAIKKVLTWGALKKTYHSEQYKYFTATLEQSLKFRHIHAFEQMMTYSKTSFNTGKYHLN